jgi:RNA polymerase sigma factor (sigma-70 family)
LAARRLHIDVPCASADQDEVAERRANAIGLLDVSGALFWRTARRLSLCVDDAEDALARAIEILLTRSPVSCEADHLVAWMQLVTRREALALRRTRERLLDGAPAVEIDALELIPGDRPGPAEVIERRERAERALRALARLKPDERLALVLQGQGYSYAEICELRGWTYTKVNRCLSEGRARLRELGGEVTTA